MAMQKKKIQIVLPLTALVLGGGVFFLTSNTRSVQAQDTAMTLANARTTAASLESAFIRIADTVGPATVSITSQQETRLTGRRTNPLMIPPGMGGDEEDPFSFFGQRPPTAPKNKQDSSKKDGEKSDKSEKSDKTAPKAEDNADLLVPRKVGSGSGMIVRADGYIVTNNHVVAPAKDGIVTVTLSDGTTYRGTVVSDPRSDLAVVKINPKKPLPVVKFADSDNVHVGQFAIAIGSPFGQENTMTTGIVSALHRKSLIQRSLYSSLIQTDAPINPGNSGGPLFNIQGEVIGVNVAIYSPSGGSNGIGFAIPANTAKRIVNQLITNGKVTRGYLGIEPTDIPPFKRSVLGVRDGAYIRSVTNDAPASKAGLQPGDVVTRFDEKNIRDENALREAIADTTPGTKATLTVWRGGNTITLTTDINTAPTVEPVAPSPNVKPATPIANNVQRLGFEVDTLTSDIRKEFSLSNDVKGVFVKEVYPGTLIAEALLERGSIILSVNNQPVTTPMDLKKIINSAKSEEVLSFKVLEPQGEKITPAIVDIQIP
jgi:serine protease Do